MCRKRGKCRLPEKLPDNMDLVILCDIINVSSTAISPFDWLHSDVLYDINILLAACRRRDKVRI